MLHSGGQKQKWPTNWQIGYITPAVGGSQMLQSREQNQQWEVFWGGGGGANGVFFLNVYLAFFLFFL